MKVFYLQPKKTDITQIKAGNVLIAQGFLGNELFHRSVVLVLEHNETGSMGIILNKSSAIIRTLPATKNNDDVIYDVRYDSCRINFFHQVRKLLNTMGLSGEIHYHDNCIQLQIISSEKSSKKKVKIFMDFTVWASGQLQEEILEKRWWIDDFKLEELYDTGGKDLWEYKLLKLRNLYGLFFKMPDPNLN